ncbi:MAG: DUF3488 and DUF4129 domain-containing transglutaminase family protein [Acidimicrobiia bacterium]
MRSRDRFAPVAEVALAAVSAAAVIAMHRLFEDGSYRGPLLLQVIAAHGLVTAVRRSGRPLRVAAGLSVLGATLTTTWLHYRDTTSWLVPTPATASAAVDDLAAASRTFGDVSAPAPVDVGFLVVTGLALWVIALLADWAAFRARLAFEALLPSALLFLVSAILGESRDFLPVTAIYAGAGLGFVLMYRTWAQERSAAWTGHHRAHGRWSLLVTGGVLACAALVAGLAIVANLPGVDAPPVWAVRDIGDSEPTRVVVSPMVEMQTRLVDQPDVEVFTVRSDRPANWRLTALDEFDGEIWRSSYGTDNADGSLERSTEPVPGARRVTQQFTIEALGSVWLPAAYEPVAVETEDGRRVEHDPESSTLIVDRDVSSSDGFTYEVTSELPAWDGADELRRAPEEVPDAIRDRYLELPDLDPAVHDLATQLTEGQPTAYDRAFAIQQHLRTYTYDLGVGRGHSTDALTSFLFETQRGYCEQFAGAFAALARSAGLPSRVAVGFTKGIQDPNDPTLFRVRGKHAHAWPEVWIGGQWVAFEPTPERGPPGAEQWLHIPEQQVAAGGDGTTATTAPAEVRAGEGTGEAGDTVAGAQPLPSEEGRQALDGVDGNDTATDRGPPRPVVDTVRTGAAAAAAYVLLVPVLLGIHRWYRWRRHGLRRRPPRPSDHDGATHRRTTVPPDGVRLLWSTTVDRAIAAGLPLSPSLTVRETAHRIAAARPGAAAAADRLAETVERLTYAERLPSEEELAAAQRAADDVIAEIRRHQPWAERLRWSLDVRLLWQRPRGRPTRLSTRQRAVVAASDRLPWA